MPRNTVDPTTKMAPKDINQDNLDKKDQQRTDDSALDMMEGMHSHEDHTEEDDEQSDFLKKMTNSQTFILYLR